MDWAAVWNALNSNLVGLVIATLIGIILATFIQWYQYRGRRNAEKVNAAIMLGGEINDIKRLSAMFLEDREKGMNKMQQFRLQGKTPAMTIGDYDFPRAVYDRPSTDLGVFLGDLPSVISELYRMVGFSKDAKDKANEFGLELLQNARMAERAPTPALKEAEEGKMRLADENFTRYMTLYYEWVGQIKKFAGEALVQIQQIKGASNPIEGEIAVASAPPLLGKKAALSG